jgi:hypothetical protein
MVGGNAATICSASTAYAIQLGDDFWRGDLASQIPIGFLLGYKSYSAMSVWLAYTAWIPNVLLVALYTLWNRRSPTTDCSAEIAS